MSELEDAKKYIGQVRTWVMGYGLGNETVTCNKVSAHVAHHGTSTSITQLSIWCEFIDSRGTDRSVWFNKRQFEEMALIETCSHGNPSNEECDQCCDEVLDYQASMQAAREAEEAEEEGYCTGCSGSGEGHYDGQMCSDCGGSGSDKPRIRRGYYNEP